MLRWTATSSRSSLVFVRAYILTVLLFCLGYFLFTQQHEQLLAGSISHVTSFPTPKSNHAAKTEACPTSSSVPKVVVAVKSGATEAFSKIPALLRTSLRCAENVVLFSDLEQDIGKHILHDALDTVSPPIIDNNPDFAFYKQQKELWQSNRNIESLLGAKNPGKHDELAAWTLDKYKFIHVLEKTWAMKPDMDWYIIVDADTYLFWSNLLAWLISLNPNKKSYFGSEVNIDGVRFAHGGSGIILSRAAVYEIVVTHNGTAAAWDLLTSEKCCGDLVLSLALQERGMNLQDVWPVMSGETHLSMPFGPATPEYWCRPVVSMHHLDAGGMRELSTFEGQRNTSIPLTHAELFNELLRNQIPLYRENWDNLSSDHGEFGKTGGVLHETATLEECAEKCEEDTNCFQYSHHGKTCHFAMSVRIGGKREGDERGIWRSGWHKDRLHDWLSAQPICNEIRFPIQDT